MAHPKNDLINRVENKERTICNPNCKYWKYPHLETACSMSSVFSVKKGELCYEFEFKK